VEAENEVAAEIRASEPEEIKLPPAPKPKVVASLPPEEILPEPAPIVDEGRPVELVSASEAEVQLPATPSDPIPLRVQSVSFKGVTNNEPLVSVEDDELFDDLEIEELSVLDESLLDEWEEDGDRRTPDEEEVYYQETDADAFTPLVDNAFNPTKARSTIRRAALEELWDDQTSPTND
jgi:hypothetical protein